MVITEKDERIVADAATLAPIFPSPDDRQWGRALLTHLAFSDTPFDSAHAAEPSTMQDALTRMPNIACDDAGVITGFAGLSRTGTAHRINLTRTDDGMTRERYGWCAWDTMFLPHLLGCTATVETTCPVTGRPITMTVAGGDAVTPDQPDALLALPLAGPFDVENARATFCCFAHLIADDEAARSWVSAHPQCAVYTLAAGMHLGRLATAALVPEADQAATDEAISLT